MLCRCLCLYWSIWARSILVKSVCFGFVSPDTTRDDQVMVDMACWHSVCLVCKSLGRDCPRDQTNPRSNPRAVSANQLQIVTAPELSPGAVLIYQWSINHWLVPGTTAGLKWTCRCLEPANDQLIFGTQPVSTGGAWDHLMWFCHVVLWQKNYTWAIKSLKYMEPFFKYVTRPVLIFIMYSDNTLNEEIVDDYHRRWWKTTLNRVYRKQNAISVHNFKDPISFNLLINIKLFLLYFNKHQMLFVLGFAITKQLWLRGILPHVNCSYSIQKWANFK